MLPDQQQRSLATNPGQSYLVEAPAGSGKTEILTQRFLRLLPLVQAPEQIIALTFTRKAASEMQRRILLALQQVDAGIAPTSPHQEMTHRYAREALAHDQACGWDLLRNGSRLRVMTIDALCQMLAHAIPRHSSHYATITDQPQVLYYQAARAYIQEASTTPTQQTDLKTLLRHLDNRQDVLVELLTQVLAQRDQWLTPLFLARAQSKQEFEQALAWIEHHELSRFFQTIPSDLQNDVFTLVKNFSTHCAMDDPRFQALEDWQNFTQMNAEQATALARLLLTSTQTLRKSFDHHIGLKRDRCPDPLYTQLKTQSKQILEALQTLPEFESALINISHLPKPEFADPQWTVLQALFQVLPLVVAHLELQFQEKAAIDFTGIAHQARLALGHADTPSDLALYWDHQIQHLLIDEFQDTSIQQFELITQLIQGWEPSDGRTLFVVGDPMQSIYRFRAAEVGLFLRAKTQGIGPVPLIPLQLSANFRSTSSLVAWVNQQFMHILPKQDDVETGAVSFHAATAILAEHVESFIQAIEYSDPDSEAHGVLHILQEELQRNTDTSIAILVRSRYQLRAMIRVLRQERIAFQGVDIDLLAQLPHLRDVWSITQAVLMPANRLAWLAVLRSPWGGLHLADLLVIARHHTSIYQALAHHQDIPDLSPEGRIRAAYIYQIFQSTYHHRHQLPLVDTLRNLLRQLHGGVILSPSEQEDLEQYWTLLRQFTVDGQLSDERLFQQQLNRLYSQKNTASRVQIMTTHKSKGLEFDCVILPGLGASPMTHDKELMRWLKLPREQDEDLFLVSPIKAVADDECRVYNYLEHLDAQKTFYESQRLLYVATTRAKQRLYLLDNSQTIRKKSFRHMLQAQPFISTDSQNQTHPQDESQLPSLWRLPLAYYQNPPNLSTTTGFNAHNDVTCPPALPRLIGIVTHSVLQWICTYHPPSYSDIPWQLASHHLKKMGFVNQEYTLALEHIQNQIQAFLQDQQGQWIAQYRVDEQNEYAILTEHGKGTRIIDRTFSEHNIRWIIDFKTGHAETNTLEKHRAQLEQYAELFTDSMVPLPQRLPIRCGLYYLASLQWIEWEPATCKTSCI